MKNESEKKKLDGSSFPLVVTIILFFVMYVVSVIMFGGRGLAKVQNFLSLFISNASLIVAATGTTTVMITGGIDISAGSVVAAVRTTLVWMMERGNIGASPVILIVLVAGCIFDLVQGFLVAYLKIQPLIVTLAGTFFARDMTLIISQEVISITNKTFTGTTIFKTYLPFGGYLNKKGVMIYPYVYPSVIITLVVLAIVFVVLKYTKSGRFIYAIGGNEQFALLLGLSVKRIRLQAYVLDGLPARLGDPLFCMNTCSGLVGQAKGSEMDAIASSVIGGTLLTGGAGNAIGSLFGVLIKSTIEPFIAFQSTLSSWRVRTIIATLLCFFIALQSLIASLKRKNR